MSIISGAATTKKLQKAFPPVFDTPQFEIHIRRRRANEKKKKELLFLKDKDLTWHITGRIFCKLDLQFLRRTLDLIHPAPESSSLLPDEEGFIHLVKEVNDNQQVIILGSTGLFRFYHFATYKELENILVQLLLLNVKSKEALSLLCKEEAEAYLKSFPHQNIPKRVLKQIQTFMDNAKSSSC